MVVPWFSHGLRVKPWPVVIQADSPVMLFSQWENNNNIFNKSRFSKNYLDSNLVSSPQKKANVHCW